MKYFLLFASIASFFYANGQSSLSKDHYVILPYDKGAYSSLPKNSTPASLDDSDLITIDHVLSGCIDQYNREQTIQYKKLNKKHPENDFQLKDFIIDLRKYYRQYMVVKNVKGEKEVWVNCFCSISEMDYWKNQIVFVQDGGNCFFNVRINLRKKTFYNFSVNGVA